MSNAEREKFYLQLLVDFILLNEIATGPLTGQYLQKVGMKQGLRLEDAYRTAHELEEELTPEQFATMMVNFLHSLGSKYEVNDCDCEKIVLTCYKCPFELAVLKVPGLCQVLAAAFGGIAARNFPYSKVSIDNSLAGRNSAPCRIVCFLARTDQAVAAAGTVFSSEPDSYLLTSKEIHSLGEELFGKSFADGKYAASLKSLQSLHREMELEYNQLRNEIFSDLRLGVVTVNEHGKITYINETAQELLRFKEESDAEVAWQFQQLLRETLLTGIRHNQQPLSMPYAEDVRYYSVNTAPLYGENGRISGAVSVFQDITEKKKMEDELLQMEKFSLVAELAAGTAHEIRNPMTTMRGFLQLLTKEFKSDSKGYEYCTLMIEEIDRANSIIKEFLLLTKPSAPKLKETDLHLILEEILLLIESKSLLENVELHKSYACDLPPARVDQGQIKQVFLNLATNAIQAMPSGGVLAISTSTEQDRIFVSFNDTGPGVREHCLNKVFDPFYTTKEGGTGLGLTISYRIVENHGGRLSVQNVPGKGAKFTVELPVARETAEAP
jgi:two-component system sensor histidine kinase AtoS